MSPTGIEWTDETWNPVTGCSKVSPGCANCYAETLALTRLAGKPGYPGLPWTPENAETNVVLRPERLGQPYRWRKPRRVFVNSMSDLFHERVPDGFIECVWDAMTTHASPHIFQVLTKRPERMRDWVNERYVSGDPLVKAWAVAHLDPEPPDAEMAYPVNVWRYYGETVPRNVWLGTSIESDRWVGRADILRETKAAVRFVSAEPLLGPLPSLDLTGIDWLIVGGESGPGYRTMDPVWVRDLAEMATETDTAVFVKQASGLRSGRQGDLPDDLWARKEYPAARNSLDFG